MPVGPETSRQLSGDVARGRLQLRSFVRFVFFCLREEGRKKETLFAVARSGVGDLLTSHPSFTAISVNNLNYQTIPVVLYPNFPTLH